MGDLTEQEFRVQNLPMELLGLTIRRAQLKIFVLSPCTIYYYSNYTAFFAFFSVRSEKYFCCPQGYRDNSTSAESMHCDLHETAVVSQKDSFSAAFVSILAQSLSLYLANIQTSCWHSQTHDTRIPRGSSCAPLMQSDVPVKMFRQ